MLQVGLSAPLMRCVLVEAAEPDPPQPTMKQSRRTRGHSDARQVEFERQERDDAVNALSEYRNANVVLKRSCLNANASAHRDLALLIA
jgi:hypothetical protein